MPEPFSAASHHDRPLPANYCKVDGCEEPFAYDHRCEKHTEADDDDDTHNDRCPFCDAEPGQAGTATDEQARRHRDHSKR